MKLRGDSSGKTFLPNTELEIISEIFSFSTNAQCLTYYVVVSKIDQTRFLYGPAVRQLRPSFDSEPDFVELSTCRKISEDL